MKLTTKLIMEVVEEVAGTDVIDLVSNIKNKENVSEFKIAEDINVEINGVRNMLYRLLESNLVSFIRKKDKKKGWYIYYWTFNTKHIKYLYKKIKVQRLEKLKIRLKREQDNQFYICPNSCIRLDFDQAINFEFRCPECGSLIMIEDNSEKIAKILEEIEVLEIKIKEFKVVKKVTKKNKPIKEKKSTKKTKTKKKVIKKNTKKKTTKKKTKN